MTQYETVNGKKYEKDMLDLSRQAKGPIDYDLSEQIWGAAIDGNKVTDIERDTVQYLLAEKECTPQAKKYFQRKLGLLEKNCPGHLAPINANLDATSQYQTIAGVKYERDLFNHAVEVTKGGKTMNLEQAKELWTKAMDGDKVTDTEFGTVDFVMAHYRLNRDAYNHLEEMLKGHETSKERTFKTVSWIPEEEEKEEEPVSEEPAAKKPKIAEPPKELEEDAAEDKRPKFKGDIVFHTPDTTLNLMSSTTGNILTSLTDSGLQSLFAGARANAGMKGGRYMFEVKVIERRDPADKQGAAPLPKAQLRLGVSTAGSSLFHSPDSSVCFDTDTMLTKLRQPISKNLKVGDVFAIVLNFDSSSPCANTISCFVNGVRASPPQPVPEKLQGETLFPTLTFRHLTLHVNFGPKPLVALPFKCRMMQDASAADVDAGMLAAPKDGKYEVVYPVGLPDEGTFEWLDMFLEKNPQHFELSDRKIVDWARQSGLQVATPSCLDRPGLNFGQNADDRAVRRLLGNIAALQRRNYVVMEVKSGLLKEERPALVSKFPSHVFKRFAQVVVGEPPADFKKRTQQHILKRKQDASDIQFKAKKLEAAKKKAVEKNQKMIEKKRRRVVKLGEAKKKLEEEKKRRAEAKEEAMTTEEEKEMLEVAESESEAEQEDAKMDYSEEPPKVDLTAEEKSVWFISKRVPDMMQATLSSSFGSFSLPQKDDGFDEIRYEWQKGPKCEEYMKKWILNRKLTTPMQELKPSMEFNKRLNDFKKVFVTWTSRQKTFKAMASKPKTLQSAVKKAEPSAEKAEKEAGKEGEEVGGEDTAMEEVKEEVVVKDVVVKDVFGVEDVCDVGEGKPLFANFAPEDWALLSLRVELHLLVHAFRLDCNDPDRVGIKPDLLTFYYNKYFKKQLNFVGYGCENAEDLVKLVRDSIYVDKQASVLDSLLPSDMDRLDVFLKLTEECRRDRECRITMGEETAKLKFMPALTQEFAQTSGSRPFAGQQGAWQQQAPGNKGWPVGQMPARHPGVVAPQSGLRPAASPWGKGMGKMGAWQKSW